nr:hypothetical protein [Halobiforma nitratireducens]
MVSQNRSGRSTASTMRETVKSVLFRADGTTTIEECRRCGKSVDESDGSCPACGCADFVEYRIR